MIFSVSKAITRQHSSVDQYQAMILDLTDVPMIDVTVGLALENAIRDAQEAHCEVYLLCPNEKNACRIRKV
ncbi:STAS domain-containing protein [Vibrio cholerae]|nr:STAS domain-containing protein [Vibrio cholerae]